MTKDELTRRTHAVLQLNYMAETLKINIASCEALLSEHSSFFRQIYKDLKLSLFLSETDPNICLLYNDGE